MTNSKTTKRALFSSVVALLLCFTMLLGTTFAWFTDSATSGNNIIKTGNLDMKLSYKPYGTENTEWTEVDESTVLFGKDALYEPGYTEAVWLKVENLGSLAFRYDLAINVANEKQGTNKAGEKFSLSDHLEVKYMTTTSTDMEKDFYTTRESLDSFAFGAATNSGVASLSDDIAVIKNGVAYSKTDAENSAWSSAYVLVVIQMPTTVGNEANHNGTDIPQIDFSLTAVATQLAHEKDSFGPDYDANAEYLVADTWDGQTVDTTWYNEANTTFVISSVEEMLGFESLVNDQKITFAGKVVELASDLDMTGVQWEPIGHYLTTGAMFQGTFDGKNHTISNLVTSTKYGGNKNEGTALFGAVNDGCVIKNLKLTNVTSWSSYGYAAALIGSVYGGNVTIENVSIAGAKIATARHVGGFIGITGRTGHDNDCTVTFTNCSMKNIEMGYVHVNGGTSNVVGDEGAQFKNTLTLTGIDSVVEENVTVTSDRSMYDTLNAAH